MRISSDSDVTVKWFGIPRLYCLIALFIVVFTVAIKLVPKQRPFVNPKIAAEPYVWPQGCAKKKYTLDDRISKKCLLPKYYIGDGQKWGWPRISSWPYYFRVGNDAIMITDVISGSVMSENPHIIDIVEDVFVSQYHGEMKNGM